MSNQVTFSMPSGTLGPAMRSLPNDRMRSFVMALLDLGSADHTRAARMAGYIDNGTGALKVQAYRLAHDDRIQAAIQEEARRRMKAGAIMAVSHLVNIADNPGHKDQLKAVGMLLDRSGLHATSEHKVSVEHADADEREALVRINAKMIALGLDEPARKKLLGQYGITDVAFEVVEPQTSQPKKEEWE